MIVLEIQTRVVLNYSTNVKTECDHFATMDDFKTRFASRLPEYLDIDKEELSNEFRAKVIQELIDKDEVAIRNPICAKVTFNDDTTRWRQIGYATLIEKPVWCLIARTTVLEWADDYVDSMPVDTGYCEYNFAKHWDYMLKLRTEPATGTSSEG